jgi:hemoglobin
MRSIAAVIFLFASAIGCGTTGNVGTTEAPAAKDVTAPKAVDPTSLYSRLGGKTAITVVIDDFVGNVGGDKRINAFFKDVNLDRLKSLLVEQVCEATGGPCKYTGRSMQASHESLKITDAHFNALVEDLVKAFDKNKVKKAEKDELLKALGSMRGDIVTVGAKKRQ